MNVLYRRRKNKLLRKYGIRIHGSDELTGEDSEEYQPLTKGSLSQENKSSNGFPMVRILILFLILRFGIFVALIFMEVMNSQSRMTLGSISAIMPRKQPSRG